MLKFGIEHAAHGSKSRASFHMVGRRQDGHNQENSSFVETVHTATLGFRAIAFGIGTSEVEHVFATQTFVGQTENAGRILLVFLKKEFILRITFSH